MGFRGDLTKNTPLEVFPDMDRQAKFKAQTYNPRFADGSADRLPVENTALRGSSLDIVNVFSVEPKFESDAFKSGKTADGAWLAKFLRRLATTLPLCVKEWKIRHSLLRMSW